MKKYILFLLLTLSFTFSVFAQEQDDEITETEIEQTIENSEHFSVGIGASILGLEPVFQYRKNNLELQGSVAFADFGLFTDATEAKAVTPKFDLGYCVTIPDLSLSISTGLSNITLLAEEENFTGFAFAEVLGLYLKVSEQIGKFEIGGKVYFPIYAIGYESTTQTFLNEILACDPSGYALTLATFTLEAKIVIK